MPQNALLGSRLMSQQRAQTVNARDTSMEFRSVAYLLHRRVAEGARPDTNISVVFSVRMLFGQRGRCSQVLRVSIVRLRDWAAS
jgi:hypothetical protein